MGNWKIGILVDNLEMGVGPGIDKAAELGADGVQLYCTSGQMHPSNMDAAARAAFKANLADKGLVLSALCGDTFKGFFNKATLAEQVADAKSFIDLAVDLGTDVVTTHFGEFPEDESDPAYVMAANALGEIGAYGAERGVFYASETGLESPEDLLDFLESVSSDAIKVNYDPANLCCRGFDHIGGVDILKDYIVHTHGKDHERGGPETPLGEGDVDYPKYLAALSKARYTGFVTIEREGGDDRVGDVARAIEFLRGL